MNEELKPCPFCGGTVEIAMGGDSHSKFFLFVTRGTAPDACECRVFMESRHCVQDRFDNRREELEKDLIAAWNRRADNGNS